MAERPVTWPRGWGAPRLLTKGQLAAYLQVDHAELASRMKRGQVPEPLWGSDPALPNARWDRQAVDRALDRASAITVSLEAAAEELDRALGIRRA